MESFAPALAFALLHSLWQGALLAVAAALTMRAMSGATAAVRHAAAMAFLIAMGLAPVAQMLIYANADAPLHAGPILMLLDGRLNTIAAAAMVAAWVAGAVAMLARHLAGVSAIVAMERQPYLDPPKGWLERADSIRRAMRVDGAVAVRVSSAVLTPCVTHITRPVIWLPAVFMTRTPVRQFEALLGHELAHVVRKDCLWGGLQTAIEALFFYHPAVWWLSKRIRQEREHACDDLAVAACGDAIALAEGLAELERARQAAPRLGFAANGGSLLQRVTRLLAPAPTHAQNGVVAMFGVVALLGALLMGQVGVGGGLPHDIHIESSAAGALGPGDYRQITTSDDNAERFYRASADARGHVTEVYREDGRERPIDADVRAWLEGVSP